MKRSVLSLIMAFVIIFSFFGCVEHRYYHRNHHHSPEYYHRHHQAPPPGIDIEIRK